MSDSNNARRPPPPPPPGGGRTWEPIGPPPPGPPDAVIIPEGQLADILPDGLLEALEEAGPGGALTPRLRAARDAFLASVDAELGEFILEQLGGEIARRGGAKESARDLCQKVLLVVCRQYEEHAAQKGTGWAPKSPRAYLRAVSRYVVKDHFKAKAKRPAISRGIEVDESAGALPDPEEAAIHAELLATFERERGTLTAGEAEVFEGRASLCMEFETIAALFQRPLGTVYGEYRRAVAKLTVILERASEDSPLPEAGKTGSAGGKRRG